MIRVMVCDTMHALLAAEPALACSKRTPTVIRETEFRLADAMMRSERRDQSWNFLDVVRL